LVCCESVPQGYADPDEQRSNELGRAFNGHLADHHQLPFAHVFGRIDGIEAEYRSTSASRSRRVWHLSVGRRSWIADLVTEDLGAAPTPLVLAPVEC
jgi:hypothetical protein